MKQSSPAGKVELEGWDEFQRLSKQGLIEWDWERNSDQSTQYEVFGRFASRWHFASNVSRIELEGSDPRTKKGYLAGLRVALAYSALEHFEDSVQDCRGAVNKLTIPDLALADRLRSSLKTYKITQSENVTDRKLRSKLDAWVSGQDPDVLIVARALRHMFAHGSFTPYGLAATRKAATEALEDLSATVRSEAQMRFSVWLQGHQGIPRSSP